MATARDIVTAALRRSQDIGTGESIDANEASDALEIFNDMMHAKKADHTNLSWQTLSLSDTVPLEEEYIFGLKAMLAETLMSDLGKPIGNSIRKQAQRGREALRQGYKPISRLVFERGLARMPSQRRITGASSNFSSA